MLALRKKILLILIGSIVIPLAIECSLRLAGWIYYTQRTKKENSKDNKDNAIKILCMGDSFTFGSGAEPGYSYPEQLERLLNKNDSNLKFIVYNRGGCLPGLNSSQLLKILDKNIAEYNPQIIIVLVGWHNKWNLTDSNLFLFTAKGWRSYLYRLDGLLTRLRTYKFLKIAIGNLNDKFSKKSQSAKKIEEIEQSPEIETHFKLADKYLSNTGAVALAIKEVKKVLVLDNQNIWAHARLGRIYENHENYEMAVEEFKKVLKEDPDNLFAHQRLWNIYFKQGKNKLALNQIKEILKIDPHEESLRDILALGLPSLEEFKNEQLQDKLLRYDLENIIALAKAKGIRPILLSYPSYKGGNKIRKEVADRLDVTFIDIHLLFQKLRSSDNYKVKNYFAKDGHCNAEGYAVIAKEIYNVLMIAEKRNLEKIGWEVVTSGSE